MKKKNHLKTIIALLIIAVLLFTAVLFVVRSNS